MDAIEYLRDQHREIESLFDQIETAARTNTKARLRRKLADLLAVHVAIEERIFYPAARDAGAEDLFVTGLVEHLSTERAIAEFVGVRDVNASAAEMRVLRERKKRHADAEEEELFPIVERLLTREKRERLGVRMANLAEQLLAPGVGARERVVARPVLA